MDMRQWERRHCLLAQTRSHFYTRNPRGGSVRQLDLDDVAALRSLMAEHSFGPLVAHAPYTYNPCSAKERAREFALEAMGEDLRPYGGAAGQLL